MWLIIIEFARTVATQNLLSLQESPSVYQSPTNDLLGSKANGGLSQIRAQMTFYTMHVWLCFVMLESLSDARFGINQISMSCL